MIKDDVLKKAIEELQMTPAVTESDTTTQKASEEVIMSGSTSESKNDKSAEKAVQEALSEEMGVNKAILLPSSAAEYYDTEGMHITSFISNYNHNNFLLRPTNHEKNKLN